MQYTYNTKFNPVLVQGIGDNDVNCKVNEDGKACLKALCRELMVTIPESKKFPQTGYNSL